MRTDKPAGSRNNDGTPKLLFGPYCTPIVQIGEEIECLVSGKFWKVGGYSDAKIMWPVAKRAGRRSLIVYGDLAKAIMLESAESIMYHFGVGHDTASKYRRVLEAGRTPGTRTLAAELINVRLPPETRIGKKRPPHVLEILSKNGKRERTEAERKRASATGKEAWKTRDKTHISTLWKRRKKRKHIMEYRLLSPSRRLYVINDIDQFIIDNPSMFPIAKLAREGLMRLHPSRKDRRQSWHGWVWAKEEGDQ